MRRRGDGGLTLIELLVTITLMGIAFGVILSALSAMYGDGDSQRKISVVEVWIRRYAEQLDSVAYVSCAQASDYATALTPAPPTDYTAAISAVTYWNGTTSATFGASRTTCLSAGDKGVERITLSVSNTNVVRPVTQTVVVMKRDPS